MSVTIKYNKSTMNKLKKLPDKVVYEIARQTLDRVGSMKITPYGKERAGHIHMEQTMFSEGVKKDGKVYTIGNYTSYAKYVYAKPQRTNWTNPNSKAQWFDWFWRTQGKNVFESTVSRYKI